MFRLVKKRITDITMDTQRVQRRQSDVQRHLVGIIMTKKLKIYCLQQGTINRSCFIIPPLHKSIEILAITLQHIITQLYGSY